MSILVEEEVFQRTDDSINRWKNKVRYNYIVSYNKESIVHTLNCPISYNEYDKFFNWIERNGKWIELDELIKKHIHDIYSEFVNYCNYVDSKPKNVRYYFNNN